MGDLEAAKLVVPDAPVPAKTGACADQLAEILSATDGSIVGTCLKVDGIIWNPVDRSRVQRFMEAAREVRERPS
jgi:predicted TIM-barrel enzyme